MLKAELRAKYRKKRNLLTSDAVSNSSSKIANRMLNLPVWHFLYYHVFLSIAENKEVDTSFILPVLQGKDKSIAVSKMHKGRSLKHFLLLDNTLIKNNRLNIPEPVDGIEVKETSLDVVFVPLLAFDSSGHRVGYGQGYYDIFLRKCRPNIIKVGLSFFEAEDIITDSTADDVALNYCVTPNMIYSF